MDAKGKSKRNCSLCEELIKMKTPDFTHGKLHALPAVEMDTSIRAPMIMFNTYMTHFTCSHHGILILEKSPLIWMQKVNLKGLVSNVKN